MLWGRPRSRDNAQGTRHGFVPGRLVTWGMVPILAVAVVAGGREPVHDVLAASSSPGTHSGRLPVLAAPFVSGPGSVHLPAGPAVRGPASVSSPHILMAQAGVVSVPAVALAAYQRAAQTVDTADPACHLDWTLLAAIGQVESDHGQVDGSSLNSHGIAHPPIYGPVLDGRNGVALVRDTDAGRLDGNSRYDRAVGPMQFLPSTWAEVAVDADGDGQRNPQDINDAALGAAVYLCSGHADMSTRAGRAAAVFRYNHSHSYVARVLALALDLQGQTFLTGVPVSLLPSFEGRGHRRHDVRGGTHSGNANPSRHHHRGGHPSGSPSPSDSPSASPTSSPSDSPSDSPSSSPTSSPTESPSDSPSASPTSSPTGSPAPRPTSSPTDSPTGSPTVDPTPVIPSPVPTELSDFTADEIAAYDAAWPSCESLLVPDPTANNEPLRFCLAAQLGVPRKDPHLLAFVDWVVAYESEPPS
jgi:hypothetical protein